MLAFEWDVVLKPEDAPRQNNGAKLKRAIFRRTTGVEELAKVATHNREAVGDSNVGEANFKYSSNM